MILITNLKNPNCNLKRKKQQKTQCHKICILCIVWNHSYFFYVTHSMNNGSHSHTHTLTETNNKTTSLSFSTLAEDVCISVVFSLLHSVPPNCVLRENVIKLTAEAVGDVGWRCYVVTLPPTKIRQQCIWKLTPKGRAKEKQRNPQKELQTEMYFKWKFFAT